MSVLIAEPSMIASMIVDTNTASASQSDEESTATRPTEAHSNGEKVDIDALLAQPQSILPRMIQFTSATNEANAQRNPANLVAVRQSAVVDTESVSDSVVDYAVSNGKVKSHLDIARLFASSNAAKKAKTATNSNNRSGNGNGTSASSESSAAVMPVKNVSASSASTSILPSSSSAASNGIIKLTLTSAMTSTAHNITVQPATSNGPVKQKLTTSSSASSPSSAQSLKSSLNLKPSTSQLKSPQPRPLSATVKPVVTVKDDNVFHPARHTLFSLADFPSLHAWPAHIRRPGVGLRNLGNSCFMNATLQALCHTPMLVNYALSKHHSKHCPIKQKQPQSQPQLPPFHRFNQFQLQLQSQSFCLFCTLEVHVHQAFNQQGSFSPNQIFNQLRTISRSLRPGRQEDAHEFLRCALDFLHNNALAKDIETPRPAPSSHGQSSPPPGKSRLTAQSSIPKALFQSLTPYELHRVKETSIIYAVFGGYYRSTLSCRSCHFQSHTFEPFLDLSLSIPTVAPSPLPSMHQHQQIHRFGGMNFHQPLRPVTPSQPQPSTTLGAALKSFTAEEQLDTANMWKCPGCHHKTKATKRLTIDKAPPVLVIHLKRFEFLFSGGGKINRHVKFDLTLDLKTCMSDSASERGDESDGVQYTLCAVLVHSGSSIHSGHYFSFVKAPNGQWFEMNDSSVSPVSVETVMNQRAYMLFYTKNVLEGKQPTGGGSEALKGATAVDRALVTNACLSSKGAATPMANGVSTAAEALQTSAKPCIIVKLKKNGDTPSTPVPAPVTTITKMPSSATVAPQSNGVRTTLKQQPATPAATSAGYIGDRSSVANGVVSKVAINGTANEKSVAANGLVRSVVASESKAPAPVVQVPGQPWAGSSKIEHETSKPASAIAPTQRSSSPTPALTSPSTAPASPPSARKRKLNIVLMSTPGLQRIPSFADSAATKFNAFSTISLNSSNKKVRRGELTVEQINGIDSSQMNGNGGEANEPVPSPQSTTKRKHEETNGDESGSDDQLIEKSPSNAASFSSSTTSSIAGENDERKRRRLEHEDKLATSDREARRNPNASTFNPEEFARSVQSQYNTTIENWDSDAPTDRKRKLDAIDAERYIPAKDEYDRALDRGHDRKVRGERDMFAAAGVRDGQNLFQRQLDERRERESDPRAPRRNDRHRSHHSHPHKHHADDRRDSRDRHDRHHSRSDKHSHSRSRDGGRRHSSSSSQRR